MPELSDEQMTALVNSMPLRCSQCGEMTSRNYCRNCDQYFYQGHAPNCPQMEPGPHSHNHEGHRTY